MFYFWVNYAYNNLINIYLNVFFNVNKCWFKIFLISLSFRLNLGCLKDVHVHISWKARGKHDVFLYILKHASQES